MFKYFKPYTHLQLYDRTGYFNSILSSSFLSAVDPSCKSTDLQIICQLEEGVHVPLDVQSAVLCSQSDFLLNLVKVAGEQPVLMLPEVEISTVQRLLELLYHGVCYFSTEYERFKLLRLLSLLRMDNVIKNLQGYQVFKPKDVNLNHMVVEVEQDQPEEEEQKLLHETECVKKKAEKSPSKLESQKKRKRISAGSEQAEKLTKRCPICHNDIAASGKGWRYPFYSHLARRHFSSQLLRDYISPDLKCLVCGKDGQSFSGPSKQGQLIAHLGGKHRLIEKYIDLDDNGDLVVKKTKKLKKTPSDAVKSDRRMKEREEVETEQGRVKRKRVLPLRYQEKTEDGSRHSQKPASPPGSLGEIPCRYCDQKFMKQAVVQSHLLSTHFRKDCEQAIRQILQRTGGKCPLCPKESWSDYSKLDWSMFLHFSRKHKIADEDVIFNEDVMRQENVDSMVRKFFPNE